MEALLGSAWEEPVKGDSKRRYYRVSLKLGILGAVGCRIVENTKRTKEKAPTHLIFHSPIGEGEDAKLGALWPCPDKPYLMGRIDLGAFGVLKLKGGATVDLRLVKEEIGFRFGQVAERKSEKSPTHQLWRLTPHARAKQEAVPAQVAASGDGEELPEEELAPDFFPEEGDETNEED